MSVQDIKFEGLEAKCKKVSLAINLFGGLVLKEWKNLGKNFYFKSEEEKPF